MERGLNSNALVSGLANQEIYNNMFLFRGFLCETWSCL